MINPTTNDADIKQEEYLDSEGNDCPACGGSAASAYPIEGDGRTASQGVYCEECGSTWTDRYCLTGFTDLKPKGNE